MGVSIKQPRHLHGFAALGSLSDRETFMRTHRSPVDIMARTRALLARNAVLRARLAAAMGRSERAARLHPRFIHGASGPEPARDVDALRRHVLGRLIEGSLPEPTNWVWAGGGSGNPCSVCGLPIVVTEIEYEFRVDDAALLAHIACFDLWKEEATGLRGASSTDDDSPPDILADPAPA
jgi:hypothetical protein